MRRSTHIRSIIMAAASLLICASCGQTGTPAATSAITVATTSKAPETEAIAPETQATTPAPETTTAETEAQIEAANVEIAEELRLTVPVDSTLLDQVPDEAIIAQAVLNYYGYTCDVETVSKYCDGASDKEEKFTKCISGYTSSQGITDIEVVKKLQDDMNAEKVFEELNINNLVVYWSFKRDECTIICGYTSPPDRYFFYDVAYGDGKFSCESFDEKLPSSEHSIYIISKK